MKILFYVTGAQGVGKTIISRQLKDSIEVEKEETEAPIEMACGLSFLHFDTVVATAQFRQEADAERLKEVAKRHKAMFFDIELKNLKK